MQPHHRFLMYSIQSRRECFWARLWYHDFVFYKLVPLRSLLAVLDGRNRKGAVFMGKWGDVLAAMSTRHESKRGKKLLD